VPDLSKALATLVLVLCCQVAGATVTENLTYSYYVARLQFGTSMAGAISKASPFHQDGRVFHAETKWYVNWHFHWTEHAGSCRMDSVQVNLDSTITLPALANDSDDEHRRFFTYLLALRKHELGHVDLGRQAARQIEDGILSLPEMRSCTELENTGNRLANRILEEIRQIEIQYDLTTLHGRTQGARLD